MLMRQEEGDEKEARRRSPKTAMHNKPKKKSARGKEEAGTPRFFENLGTA
jgi:hypothetical protein